MPVYIGLPVLIEEAFRLFNLDIDQSKEHLRNTKKIYLISVEYYLPDFLNEYFKSLNLSLRCYVLDKGLNVIGYEIEEVSNVWTKFISANNLIELIKKLKEKFISEIKDYNFSKVTIEHMEGDSVVIDFTEPYVIEWH